MVQFLENNLMVFQGPLRFLPGGDLQVGDPISQVIDRTTLPFKRAHCCFKASDLGNCNQNPVLRRNLRRKVTHPNLEELGILSQNAFEGLWFKDNPPPQTGGVVQGAPEMCPGSFAVKCTCGRCWTFLTGAHSHIRLLKGLIWFEMMKYDEMMMASMVIQCLQTYSDYFVWLPCSTIFSIFWLPFGTICSWLPFGAIAAGCLSAPRFIGCL